MQLQLLDEINSNIADKEQEIADKESQYNAINSNLDASNPDSYTAQIQDIVNMLSCIEVCHTSSDWWFNLYFD